MSLRTATAVVAALALTGSGLAIAVTPASAHHSRRAASPCSFSGSLNDFYTAPSGAITAAPGTLIRCQERTDIKGLTGAKAYRVMYVSEAPAPGSYVAAATLRHRKGGSAQLVRRYSTGMIFVPTAAAPVAGGRKVVAWDHGTVGMGQTCAPSISGYGNVQEVTPGSKPNMSYGFVQNMVDNNWVVAATDYAGLGIIGQSQQLQYLVGASEAMDTVNAVRVAVEFPGSGVKSAGKPAYAVYGQSQGGQASLWTGVLGPTYGPELDLKAVAASDPAANLVPLVQQQYDKLIAWVLGPEVAIAWPGVQPSLKINDVLTRSGMKNYESVAAKCVTKAAVTGLEKDPLGLNPFFKPAVTTNADWVAMQRAQTPSVIMGVPVLIGQTTNDGVVLANTTASLQKQWCDAGANLSMYWVEPPKGLGEWTFGPMAEAHLNSAWVDALASIAFISNAFAGTSTPISGVTPCSTPPPSRLS